jgi:ubiquinone/menaquinone biosynthesis C-methylase UbiE
MIVLPSQIKCLYCDHTDFWIETAQVVCKNCNHRYIVQHDIPDMRVSTPKDHFAETSQIFYDNNAPKYDANWEEYEPWQIELRESFIAQLKQRSPNPELLDLGCGPGRDVAFFKNHGCSPTGVDLSLGQLRQAKQKSNVPLLRVNMKNLPLSSNGYDGIWCCVSFVHVQREEAMEPIQEMYRILKPDGLLFISVIEGDGTVEAAREIYDNLKEIFELYTADELTRLLSIANFSIQTTNRHEEFKGRNTSEITGGVKTYIDIIAKKKQI